MGVPRVGALVLVLALCVAGASAQSNTSDCSSAYSQLSPCLSFVTGMEHEPNEVCCTAVVALNNYNASCLCQGVTTFSTNASGTDPAKVWALPDACGVLLSTYRCPTLAPPPPPYTPPLPKSPPPPAAASHGNAAAAVARPSAFVFLAAVFSCASWLPLCSIASPLSHS